MTYMDVPDKKVTVKEAYDDLLRRSLSKIRGDLARLIYLASTRDYNTGKYHHDGLAARFQAEIAGVWQKLEPYRVALPVDVNVAAAQLFVSNVKLALAILCLRQQLEAMEASAS